MNMKTEFLKNKKILFITDSCPPYLTMSGIVVKNIIDSLIGIASKLGLVVPDDIHRYGCKANNDNGHTD